MHPRSPLADCIEAGLPYDWDRIDIASDTEKEIVRALLTVSDAKVAAASEAAAAAVATAETAAEAAAATAPEGAHAENIMPEGSSGSTPASTPEGGHAENVMREGSRSAPANTPHDGAQGSTACGHCPAGAITGTADGACNATPVAIPIEASAKRQRKLAGTCASCGVDCAIMMDDLSRQNSSGLCAMTDGLSRQNCSGRSRGEIVGVGGDAGKVEATIKEGVKEAELSAAARWESVGLREVKDLAPGVEYWQIRMVLARFKSGWCGCARSA